MLVHLRILLFIAAATFVSATPGGYVPLDIAIQSTDAIVAGTMVSGSISEKSFRVSLAIDRTFKGAIPVRTITVSGQIPTLVTGNRPITVKDRGLWFLRRDASYNDWIALPLQPGGLRAHYYWLPAEDVSGTLPASQTVAGQLVEVTAHAIATGNRNDEDLVRLLSSLRSIEASEVDSVFAKHSHSGLPRGRLLAAAWLLTRNDPKAALETAQIIGTQETGSYDRVALINGLYGFRGVDPQAVAALGELAVNMPTGEFVRRAAGFALARIHTPAALPFLARLLDSEDSFVRSQAVAGFSEFTAGVPAAASDEERRELISTYVLDRLHRGVKPVLNFESEQTVRHFHQGTFTSPERERELIQFWKDWWAANKIAVNAQP